MVLGGLMDYTAGHAQPGAYNAGSGPYGQPEGFGPSQGYGSSQPYQPTNHGGYPSMDYGNAHYNGSSVQQVSLYPNSAAPLPSKHQMVAPEGYDNHSYDHGIKPQGYYEKPSKNDYYGNNHGYEKPSKNDYYGNSHGHDYEKHSKTDYYGKAHGGYGNHSNGHEGYGNGKYPSHEGYGNSKYPSHGANRVESLSYNYYSSDGQENKNHSWTHKGLDE